MKHSRSRSETAIRSAVVEKLRSLYPHARIVHELNTAGMGSSRIDVAAICRQTIIAVEIKSEKDNLIRLADQFAAFNSCCHFVFIAAHEKHFKPYRDPRWRQDIPDEFHLNHEQFYGKYHKHRHVWSYPNEILDVKWFKFDPILDTLSQPKASAMLEMLWADELRDECIRHSIPANSRSTRPVMIRQMVWSMTGRQVTEAVCRQLRQRAFTEADAPINE